MKEFQQIGRTISDKIRDETFYGIIPQRLSGKKVLHEKDIKKIDMGGVLQKIYSKIFLAG